MSRPKKRGRRYPSGKLIQEKIGPTPENDLKRRIIVGSGENGKKADPVLSTTPIDALYARRRITLNQLTAAWAYAKLHRAVVGSPFPRLIGSELGASDIPDGRMATIEAQFRQACEALMAHSRAVKDAVDNAVVYQRWPRLVGKPRKSDERLYIGLRILEALLIHGKRQAA